jgi:hypothetical protein
MLKRIKNVINEIECFDIKFKNFKHFDNEIFLEPDYFSNTNLNILKDKILSTNIDYSNEKKLRIKNGKEKRGYEKNVIKPKCAIYCGFEDKFFQLKEKNSNKIENIEDFYKKTKSKNNKKKNENNESKNKETNQEKNIEESIVRKMNKELLEKNFDDPKIFLSEKVNELNKILFRVIKPNLKININNIQLFRLLIK